MSVLDASTMRYIKLKRAFYPSICAKNITIIILCVPPKNQIWHRIFCVPFVLQTVYVLLWTIMMGYALHDSDSYTDNGQCTTKPNESLFNHRNRLWTGVPDETKKKNELFRWMDCVPVLHFGCVLVRVKDKRREKITRHREKNTSERIKYKHRIEIIVKKRTPFFRFLNWSFWTNFKQSKHTKKCLVNPIQMWRWNLLHTFPRWMIFMNGIFRRSDLWRRNTLFVIETVQLQTQVFNACIECSHKFSYEFVILFTS